MALKLVDLVALSTADDESNTIRADDRDVFPDPTSRDRLIEEGLIDNKGNLTEQGIGALKSVRKKEEELKKGIPFTIDSKRDSKRLCRNTEEPWFFIMMGQDEIVANGEFLFVGKPELAMKAIRGDNELKINIQEVIRNCGVVGAVQVWPHTYQAFSLGGIDLVWFSDESQKLMVPILAKYVDFILSRFDRATFWAKNSVLPIQAKVRGKGTKNSVVALIATFAPEDQFENPKRREGWKGGEDMSEPRVPVVGKDGRSSVREGKKK